MPFAGKVPEYIRYLPSLHRLFPSARSIHLIRDGRDVALSMLEWITLQRWLGRMPVWREELVALCALRWRRQVLDGQRGRDRVGAEPRQLRQRPARILTNPTANGLSIGSSISADGGTVRLTA